MRALGLMSGTSMDGVDAAVLESDGRRITGLGAGRFFPYRAEQRAVLRAHQGRWPGEDLVEALAVVQGAHIAAVQAMPGCEIVGFHGQTLAHDPDAGRTHQLGDGAALAQATGCRVVWDFRSADMAAGGQGAPLVPVFHHALAGFLGMRGPVVFLNLGGVGNITLVDADAGPEVMRAGDTGPANALIDDLMQARCGAAFDEGGALALRGRADGAIVDRLLEDRWFARPLPKSADRNQFQAALGAVAHLTDPDAAATLALFTARSVARHVPAGAEMLVMGGGRHNRAVMSALTAEHGSAPRDIDALGLDGDMIEAQAFAYLALRVVAGLPTSFPGTTGCKRPVCGGVVSEP